MELSLKDWVSGYLDLDIVQQHKICLKKTIVVVRMCDW
jgi:hypothetical protein